MEQTTVKWYNTRKGIIFRVILCVLTFVAGMTGCILVAYFINMFGSSLLSDPDKTYYATDYYGEAIKKDLAEILQDARNVSFNDALDRCAMIDIGSGASYDYDTSQMEYAYSKGEIPSTLSELNVFKKYKGKEDLAQDEYFCYYNYAYNCLKKLKDKNAFIHLSREQFVDMIMNRGVVNTNYRVSNRFPQDAIFVFSGIKAPGQEAESDSSAKESSGGYNLNDYYQYSMVVEADEENEENRETVYSINAYPDLDKVGYLVYEPSTQVFYSPWDDYFNCMDSYIYSVDELLAVIEEKGATNANTDSMLFPMIWSKNYSVSEMFQKAMNVQHDIQSSKETLEKETGIWYYIKKDKTLCANVDTLQDIEALPEYYQLKAEKVRETGAVYPVYELLRDEQIKNLLSAFPKDTMFTIGINEDVARDTDYYRACRGLVYYRFYTEYGGVIEVGVVFAFVLLLLQVVWLLYTTAHCSEKGRLYAFDRLPTELWGFFCLAGLGIIVMDFVWVVRYMMQRSVISIAKIAGLTAAVSVPLGLGFLLLIFSIVRRIRERNLVQLSWIANMMKSWKKGIRNNVRQWSGAGRLFCAMTGYVLVNVVMMTAATLYDGENRIVKSVWILCFLLVQVGACVVVGRLIRDGKELLKGLDAIKQGEMNPVAVNERTRLFQELANGVNHISDGLQVAVETSLKDERMKTELITNVSHDLKTPLTSIINYINLLKSQTMPTPEAEHYVEVLDAKAQRLRHLTEDLVEAAKATSGNVELEMMPLAFDELMRQSIGEFEDKYTRKALTILASYPENPIIILADGRRMFRVLENILQNAYKYSLEGTRVYADLICEDHKAVFTLKNISAAALNIQPEELMERFTRGDSARSTEGSGLGLSIAKDLTRLQGGTFDIQLDGDLFKVVIMFPEYEKEST